MTFSPVIPTRWFPLRATINQFLTEIIAAFQAQVPDVIRKQWTAVPATYTGEVPLIWLGDITEEELFSGSTNWSASIDGAGLRHMLFTGTIEYVDVSPDNQEAGTRADSFADYMREVFAANARIYSTGILQQTGLTEFAISEGPLTGFYHYSLTYTFTILVGDPIVT